LFVFRSLRHTYAQLVDDSQGKTLLTVSTVKLGDKKLPNGSNISAARDVGKGIAEAAQKLGIKRVVFDRGGYIYHGRVKAVAQAARDAGLEF
jgi:large subunit ribosomal protein L18